MKYKVFDDSRMEERSPSIDGLSKRILKEMLIRENLVGTKGDQALYEALEFGALFCFTRPFKGEPSGLPFMDRTLLWLHC